MKREMVSFMIFMIPVLFFILLGYIFSRKKGAFLIAGYNTMSKEEKAKYNEEALLKEMSRMMFFLAFSITFWAFGIAFHKPILFGIGMILFILIIVIELIYINSAKFKK